MPPWLKHPPAQHTDCQLLSPLLTVTWVSPVTLEILSSVSFTIVIPTPPFSQDENFVQFVHFHIPQIFNTQHTLYKHFLVTPAYTFNTWKDEAGGLHEFQASLSYKAGIRPDIS